MVAKTRTRNGALPDGEASKPTAADAEEIWRQQAAAGTTQSVTIAAPNFMSAVFRIRGTAPYVQNKFDTKALQMIHEKQAAGSTAAKGKKREPRDFKAQYERAMHKADDGGWRGIPATAFRAAMIDACRAAGFQMTKAKMAVFIDPDGYDGATPLVRIIKGEPEYFEGMGRNKDGGVDLRVRAKWAVGWEADVRVRWDGDMFTLSDVTHLLMRVGVQVGVGEGRPFSENSAGQGWGLFDLVRPPAG